MTGIFLIICALVIANGIIFFRKPDAIIFGLVVMVLLIIVGGFFLWRSDNDQTQE